MILKLEVKNNTLVEQLFKNRSVSKCQRKRLESRPGIMFSQPKIHIEAPMLPIL